MEARILTLGLLTEHASLSFIAMQKALRGAPDLPAVLAALNRNSAMLGSTLAARVGTGGFATSFPTAWQAFTHPCQAGIDRCTGYPFTETEIRQCDRGRLDVRVTRPRGPYCDHPNRAAEHGTAQPWPWCGCYTTIAGGGLGCTP